MASAQMGKPSTKPRQNEIPYAAVLMLRMERGGVARIARRLKLSPSHVSKVLAGARRSERVRRAVLREVVRAARSRGLSRTLKELMTIGEG